MVNVFLLLDVNYLAHRAFYTTGMLRTGNSPTGVLYGLFRDVKFLSERFATDHFCFCFDQGESKRKQIYPEYKAHRARKILTDEEDEKLKDLKRQINLLRSKYLPELGYKNVFATDGYEADDVIASCVENKKTEDAAVIVSGDNDLIQCIRHSTHLHQPRERRTLTEQGVIDAYGVTPDQWIKVKAIAGCKSDNIPGVAGIGELRALQYMRGEMDSPKKGVRNRYKEAIHDWFATDQYRINLRLIRLPYPGCPNFVPKSHAPIDDTVWDKVMKSLGMPSLLRRR